ncbi:MAG: hypothetical protein NC548_45655 [Lachnospiraceae bacterium]|nr:hypothetical protein [Lachnospiraceae bacterium]MCM1367172.1 hypothetical protein [Prevotella sp.]
MKKFTFAAMAAMMAVNAMAINDEPVIDAEGTEVLYSQTMTGNAQGYINTVEVENASIYFADDNKVYFFNMDGMTNSDTFVVGEKKGDKIEVVLPQLIAEDYDIMMQTLFAVVEPVPVPDEYEGIFDSWYEAVKAPETVVTFSIAEDGTISLDPLSDEKGIGVVYVPDLYGAGCMFAITEMSYVPNQGSSVKSVEAIVNETYFDLSGRKVASPADGGIYLKVATLKDGTLKTSKVVK